MGRVMIMIKKKSTFNYIKGIREDDSRGRHTTTNRELLLLPGGCRG